MLARIVTIVTGDEKCFSFYEPETKRNSQKWRPTVSATPLKPRTDTREKKRMAIVFWDRGHSFNQLGFKGQSIKSEYYCQVLTELKETIKQKQREVEPWGTASP